jgi:hypothetical protein
MAHHARIDDHPGAMFGLIVGSLAVLMMVLVFAVYDRAQEASKHSPIQHSDTLRR